MDGILRTEIIYGFFTIARINGNYCPNIIIWLSS